MVKYSALIYKVLRHILIIKVVRSYIDLYKFVLIIIMI